MRRGCDKGIDVALPPSCDRFYRLLKQTHPHTKSRSDIAPNKGQIQSIGRNSAQTNRGILPFRNHETGAKNHVPHELTGASEGSLALKHHFNSWLSSVISMPAITMNLQLSISRGSSSSGSWQLTRQY